MMTGQEIYILSRWMYSIGEDFTVEGDEEPYGDQQYNRLHNFIRANNLLPEYTSRSWSSDPCPVELLRKYDLEKYAYKITLTEKTSSIESILLEIELEHEYEDIDDEHIVIMKEDGWNTQARYHKKSSIDLQTRGRASDAIDINSVRYLLPEEVDFDENLRVLMEAVVEDKNFKELKELFPEKKLVSQRASVRTALANDTSRELVTFKAHGIKFDEGDRNLTHLQTLYYLEKWGFRVPYYRVVKNYKELLLAIKDMSALKDTYGNLTDGLVVINNITKKAKAIRLGAWKEKVIESYVIGYEETESAQYYGLNVLIYSIKLDNSTIKRVPVTNWKRVRDLDLRVGWPICFTMRSGAVPVLDEKSTKLLHDPYSNYDKFRLKIENNELTKKCMESV